MYGFTSFLFGSLYLLILGRKVVNKFLVSEKPRRACQGILKICPQVSQLSSRPKYFFCRINLKSFIGYVIKLPARKMGRKSRENFVPCSPRLDFALRISDKPCLLPVWIALLTPALATESHEKKLKSCHLVWHHNHYLRKNW